MRKLRQVMTVMAAAFLALASPSAALAAVSLGGAESTYERVYDDADLFSDSEEKKLSETAKQLREKMKMDVALVTTEDSAGYSSQEYADRFYNDNEMGIGNDDSGVLLLIDMDNREIVISTEGKMIRYLTDARIETILDDVYDFVADGNYYGGAGQFLTDVEICYGNKIASNQYNQSAETGAISRYKSIRWYEVLFAFVVAVVCAAAAVIRVEYDYGMKKKHKQLSANFNLSYRNDSSFNLGTLLADVLLASYVTQKVISSSNNSRGSSGSGSRSLSSGGRSTTHRTGGHTHGGGSRKF